MAVAFKEVSLLYPDIIYKMSFLFPPNISYFLFFILTFLILRFIFNTIIDIKYL